MQIYGEVLSILTSTHLLVRAYPDYFDQFRSERRLNVYQTVHAEGIAKLGIGSVHIPKGEIQIIHQQQDDIFLAARFREGDRTETSTASAYEALFARKVVIPGTWSASIDDDDALPIQIDRNIKAGDAVGMP
jgi:hypothetical protein